MTGGAAAAGAAYAALCAAVGLVSAWAWQRPGLLSAAVAAVVLGLIVALPWWLLTILTYGPVSPDAVEWAAAVYAALLAAAAAVRTRHQRARGGG